MQRHGDVGEVDEAAGHQPKAWRAIPELRRRSAPQEDEPAEKPEADRRYQEVEGLEDIRSNRLRAGLEHLRDIRRVNITRRLHPVRARCRQDIEVFAVRKLLPGTGDGIIVGEPVSVLEKAADDPHHQRRTTQKEKQRAPPALRYQRIEPALRGRHFSNGSRIRMTSSRSGDVLRSATGLPTSSSSRRTYFTASPGSCVQLRAPRVEPLQPLIVS